MDENALAADRTEVFNLSGSQVKNILPTTGIDSYLANLSLLTRSSLTLNSSFEVHGQQGLHEIQAEKSW